MSRIKRRPNPANAIRMASRIDRRTAKLRAEGAARYRAWREAMTSDGFLRGSVEFEAELSEYTDEHYRAYGFQSLDSDLTEQFGDFAEWDWEL